MWKAKIGYKSQKLEKKRLRNVCEKHCLIYASSVSTKKIYEAKSDRIKGEDRCLQVMEPSAVHFAGWKGSLPDER